MTARCLDTAVLQRCHPTYSAGVSEVFAFASVPVLGTERLTLRAIDPEGDLQALFDLFADERVALSTDTGPFTEMWEAQQVMDWFSAIFTSQQGLRWAITLRDGDGALIGTCGFNIWSRRNNSAEIGYDLMPDFWGRGIAPEAVGAMIEWGFEHMALNRIQADVMVDNGASARVLEKLGFKEEGLQRQGGYWRGEYHDLRYFGLLREDEAR